MNDLVQTAGVAFTAAFATKSVDALIHIAKKALKKRKDEIPSDSLKMSESLPPVRRYQLQLPPCM